MKPVLVDSDILLDVLTGDRASGAASGAGLARLADEARLVINPVIYAEVSARFSRIEDLEAALPRAVFEREALPDEAAFLAGKVFLAYRRRGGAKRSPLPDFFIGAHAAVAGYRLLTRDRARYGAEFPGLEIVEP